MKTFKKLSYLVLIFGLIYSALYVSALPTSATRIAVIGFESSGLSWTDDPDLERDILEEITRKYTDKLVENDIGEVVERTRVRDMLEQFDHDIGDSFQPGYSSHFGRMTESDLLIIGSLDRLRLKEEGSVSVGPVKISGINAEVELSARLVNAATGSVITTFRGQGEASDTGLEISELEGISIGSGAFADSAVGKAIDTAVTDIFEATLAQEDSFEVEAAESEERTIEAEVVAIVGESLVIDKGSDDEVRENISGKISRDVSGGGDPMVVTIGSVEVASVDADTALIKTTETHEEPEVGDMVELSLEEAGRTTDRGDQPAATGQVFKKFETPEFIIYIDEAFIVSDRATITGRVEAKEEAELSLFFRHGYDFHDHQGTRREIKNREVKIGSSSLKHHNNYNLTKITEKIIPGYPQVISWTIDNVPRDSDHLSRLRFYIETESAGEMELNLDGIELDTY